MKKYYFTFGQSHFSLRGEAMKDYYVTVTASNHGRAREHFCTHFALPIMGRADKWAFQYEEDHPMGEYWPNGEYDHLYAPNNEPAVKECDATNL